MSATNQPVALPAPPGDELHGLGAADERPHLHVVEAPARSRAAWYLVGYAVVIVLTILGAVGLNALAAGDAVRARDLDRGVTTAERDYTLLIAEVARLETPERIREAAGDLGMVPATDPTYLDVDALPGDADPVPAEQDESGPVAGEDPLKPVLSVQR